MPNICWAVSQAAFGGELPGRQVGQPAVPLEVGDDLLDDGVPAVVDLDREELAGPVGDERLVAPVRDQRNLAVPVEARGGLGPTDDETDVGGLRLSREDRERDLRDVGGGLLLGR